MINILKAYDAFQQYIASFDSENEKIRLKLVHTRGVIESVRKITGRLVLSEETEQLAELIALLHDIGRFEQIRLFDSFEPNTMDHATYGVQLLFGEQMMIRQFIEDDRYDDIIRVAIAKHSDFALGEIEDDETLFHARMIRDADKLDNCRVKLEESMQVLLGMDPEEVGRQQITEKIWESCRKRQAILAFDRKSKLDYWISYIAYFYDINFAETLEIIREENYVDLIVSRIDYQLEDTKIKMEQLRRDVRSYINERCDAEMGIKKNYQFWGWKTANVPPIHGVYNGIYTPRDMYDVLSRIWCADTCAPRMRENWSEENKTLGQCSITAFLVQDVFGGKVYGIKRPGGNYHCYNVIGDCAFDLTSEQFGEEVLDYTDNPEQFREVHFAKEEKYLRYLKLKEEFERLVR